MLLVYSRLRNFHSVLQFTSSLFLSNGSAACVHFITLKRFLFLFLIKRIDGCKSRKSNTVKESNLNRSTASTLNVSKPWLLISKYRTLNYVMALIERLGERNLWTLLSFIRTSNNFSFILRLLPIMLPWSHKASFFKNRNYFIPLCFQFFSCQIIELVRNSFAEHQSLLFLSQGIVTA
jgi:hypothetical protein